MIYSGVRLHRFLKLSNCMFDCRMKLCNSKMATLESLHFDNLALRSLPLDQETENLVRQVRLYQCYEHKIIKRDVFYPNLKQ